ncbi:MAG: serine/threonine-protein kinase [Sulfurifustaceae bacterium]
MRTGNTVILGQNVAARRIGPAVPAPSAKAAPDQPFEPGTRIDRYLVLDRVGGGGTGQVYRARDTELDREVALKVIGRPYCHQPEALNRLRAEAQAQARLRSPQVVTLYSLLELPFAAMLVLEYLEGETLESRLRRGGPLSPEEAIAIFDQALIGLEHVHEMGVIHRDLKPSNIYLTACGQVKLMDFSVAKLDARDAYPPRTMVGTLLYISPEQISGRDTDVRSDVYALGVTLYEAVTGRLPFERRTDYGLMHAHVQEQPPSPREIVHDVPPDLAQVIMKAIEKEPVDRYQSATEFRAALRKLSDAPQTAFPLLPANAYGPAPLARSKAYSARRFFAGFGLDLTLVASICAVLYALGLYPGRDGTSADNMVTAPGPQRIAVTRPAHVSHSLPSRASDPYRALRQAWGE